MKVPVDVRCIECPLAFCCANCRRAHERTVHQLKYECPICREERFLCSVNNLQNQYLLRHIAKEHFPLHCSKCEKLFSDMDDFDNIGNCCIECPDESENETTTNFINEEKEIEDKFNSLYEKIANPNNSETENFEAIISFNKSKKTATITPVLQKKQVDSSTDSSEDEDPKIHVVHTPYPKVAKTPRVKRTATPHIKKFLTRQLAQFDDEYIDADEDSNDVNSNTNEISSKNLQDKIEVIADDEVTNGDEISGVQALQQSNNTGTPSRMQDNEEPEQLEEVHTPTSHMLKPAICATLASAVTTSTPTHPVSCQWVIFPDQGADSPLSEIEGTAENASPQQSIDESSKGDIDSNPSKSDVTKKLKSIIFNGLRPKVQSQDSSEKQVTFAESVCSSDCSSSKKKVKFAEDTKFDDAKPKRVFRRPKRLLTPGPQKMHRCTDPRFQALINKFENQGMTMARTPIFKRDDPPNDLTPANAELVALPARAINFKEDCSPSIDKDLVEAVDSPGNELFKSCLSDSPAMATNGNLNTAIAAFTTNIAGSLQTCLSSALQMSDDATEIQFKFVITKKKVSVRRIVDDGKVVDEKSSEFERHNGKEGDNIWSTIARAVKNVFWGKQEDKENKSSTTPITFCNAKGSFERQESAVKRKCEDVSDSDVSPLNHKRCKYMGRIRGRRPLNRMSTLRYDGVCGLKMSHSAEQQNLLSQFKRKEDANFNQSF